MSIHLIVYKFVIFNEAAIKALGFKCVVLSGLKALQDQLIPSSNTKIGTLLESGGYTEALSLPTIL